MSTAPRATEPERSEAAHRDLHTALEQREVVPCPFSPADQRRPPTMETPVILDARGEKAAQFYEETYVGAHPLFLRPGKRLVLAGPDPRVCRFCGRDSANTRFRHDAHAIPHLLGNRTLFTREECDQCNLFFGSTIENDLGNWTKPTRTFSRIKGKNGVPTLKNEKEGWRIEYDGRALQMTQYESNPNHPPRRQGTSEVGALPSRHQRTNDSQQLSRNGVSSRAHAQSPDRRDPAGNATATDSRHPGRCLHATFSSTVLVADSSHFLG